MSAKKGDFNLLMPGPDGWEIWTGNAESGFQQRAATDKMQALDVTGFASGGIAMAIPIRQISAVPFRAQTDDLALLGDLAAIQLEKNGTRPVLDGGQLTDHFVYGTAPEETHLTAIVMNPPSEGQLPRKSPDAFDISPRCLPLPEGQVVVWRELGRWVFAIGKPGYALYFQCLSSDRLDARAGNEIRLAMTQLQIQGLVKELPAGVVVWSHGSATDARPEELEALSRGVELTVDHSPRPGPIWPTPPSRLLPADVRAERLQVRGRRNRNLLIAAGVIAYLAIAGFLYFNLQKAKEAAALAQREADSIAGEAKLINEHTAKWDELRPVVETEYQPLDVLKACQEALPNTPGRRYIRLRNASVTNQFKNESDGLILTRVIVLDGIADEAHQPEIPKFARNLKNSPDLQGYVWTIVPEITDKRSGKFTFTYTGTFTQ